MPYLALNGVPIPTAKGGSLEPMEIGSRNERAISGGYIKDVRALKRRWRFRTVPVSEMRALAIMGLLQGRGLYIAGESVNASNGRVPTGTIPTRAYYAADGAVSRDEFGVPEAKNARAGSASIVGDANTMNPNLLIDSIAEANTLGGVDAVMGSTPPGSLSVVTNHKWQGSACLRASNGATGNYLVYGNAGGLYLGALNTRYTMSCYVKKDASGPASCDVVATLEDSANGVFADSPTINLTAAMGWRRFTATIMTPVSGSMPSLKWYVDFSASNSVHYVDGLQLETNPAGAFPTTFAIPGGAAILTDYRFGVVEQPNGSGGMTFNYWATKPYALAATNAIHVMASAFGATPVKEASVYAPLGSPTTLTFSTGSPYDLLNATVAYTGWHMVTAVLRYNPEAGEYNKYLYFDGVLKATGNHAVPAATDVFENVWIGGYQPTALARSYSRLDDVQILPFPVDARTVSGWYAGGADTTLGDAPILRATGSFCGSAFVRAAGCVESFSIEGYQDAGVWRSNGRVIEFTLEEI